MNTEYAPANEDNVLITDIVHDSYHTREYDPRPQTSGSINKGLRDLNISEQQKINNIIMKETQKKNKTIMDEKLGDIIDNTFNFLGNFLQEYYEKVEEAKVRLDIEYGEQEDTNKQILIYSMGFFLLIRDSKKLIYTGVFLVMLSFITSFFYLLKVNDTTKS